MDEAETPEDLLARGDLHGAVAAYGALLARDGPGGDRLAARGGLLMSLGRLAEAQADFEAAAQADPSSPWPLQRLSNLLSASGRPYAAVEALTRAMERAPWLGEVRVNAAQAFLALEQFDRAYAAVRPLVGPLPGWWAGVRDRAHEHRRAYHLHSRNLLREMRGDLHGHPRALELAQTLAKVGRLRLAEHLARALADRDPGDVEPWLLLARVQARRDGPPAAAAALAAGRDRFGGDPRFDRALLRLFHDAGDAPGVWSILGPEPAADDDDHTFLARATASLGGDDSGALRRLCRVWRGRASASVPAAGFVAALEVAHAPPPVLEGDPHDAEGVVLAQYWDQPEPPEDVQAVMASWREHHPGLEVRRFHVETARDHLRSAFGGEVVGVFDLCRHAAMQADLFRLGWLLSEGGVWADADERCLRPMGPLLAWAAQQELTAPLSGEIPGYVHNFFLGARRGSRAIESALDAACAAVDAEVRSGRRPDIWATTGPGLVTRVAADRLLSWTSGGAASGVRLISAQQYACFVRTEHHLAYKQDPAANWHTA